MSPLDVLASQNTTIYLDCVYEIADWRRSENANFLQSDAVFSQIKTLNPQKGKKCPMHKPHHENSKYGSNKNPKMCREHQNVHRCISKNMLK